MSSIGRRDFLVHAAALAASISGLSARRTAGPRLIVTHVHALEEVMDDVLWGIRMGVDEARHAAAMFGGSVELREILLPFDARSGTRPPLSLPEAHLQVVIPGLMDAALFDETRERARTAGALLFNGSRRDAAAYARCDSHVFHVRPSPSTMAAARASLPQPATGDIETWAPGLRRFGADSLARRFHEFAGRSMSSSSWCGWFAVKSAWEATLQSKAATSAALGSWLETPAARFDGHKGAPLHFDASHELVQPLYLVHEGEVTGEADPISRSSPTACT
jgi:hypothetical protein